MHRSRWVGMLMALVAFLVVQGLHQLGWLDGVEGALLSACFRVRGDLPATHDVVVVDLRPDADGRLPGHPWPVRHFSNSVAVTEQRPDRHHPSCGLQFLRQACDEDRVPASLCESIIQSQRSLEHGPADR